MKEQPQYDSSLKALFQEQLPDILPYILPNATFQRTLNVEVMRPTMRVDRVFEVWYRNQAHILHLEFESSASPVGQMEARLLSYHALIYQEHRVPVISIIIYPFKVTTAISPLRITSGTQDILIFYFQLIELWRMQAHQFVQQHAVGIYALLPTMQGANEDVLMQAIDEMDEAYKEDEAKLARQLIWMGILLRRSDTVSLDTKRKVGDKLQTYDRLWEEDPRIQEFALSHEMKGRAEGLVEGKVEGKSEAVLDFVMLRFPRLVVLARQKLGNIHTVEVIDRVKAQIFQAEDEAQVRRILEQLDTGKQQEASTQ